MSRSFHGLIAMTFFEDLSPYTYSEAAPRGASARNVGWLDAKHDFPRERPRPELLDALWEYCSILVVPTRGLHGCELCTSATNTFARRETKLLLGSGEIRVLGSAGDVFAAPNLIFHYICDHQYQPPQEFRQAVEMGPHPTSAEYRRLLDRLGLSWRENLPVSDEPKRFRFVRTEDGVEQQEEKGGGGEH